MKEVTDKKFPQMEHVLDMPLMHTALQERLFLDHHQQNRLWEILSCKLGEHRYKPGKSCTITYHLEIKNLEMGSIQRQVLCGRLYQSGEALNAFDREECRDLFSVEGMHPVIYMEDLEMLVWVFPNDRKLSGLAKILELSYLHDLLPRSLSSLDLQKSSRLINIETEIIHYLPECSCMIRYKLEVEDRFSGKLSQITIYGKAFPDESGAEIYSTMCQLSAQISSYKTAEPLGYDPELKVLWQSEVPGLPLIRESILEPSYLKTMKEIAISVAEFHRTTVTTSQHFCLEDIILLLNKTVDTVRESHPQLAGRTKTLVSSLLSQSAETNRPPLITPLHRDLKLGNMLLRKGNVALIDLDCVCLGDPLSDVGSFIANFYLNALYVDCPIEVIRARVKIFCRVYADHVDWDVPEESLYWYISASFVYEIIRRSIRQWSLKRLKHMDQFLDLSERYCLHRI